MSFELTVAIRYLRSRKRNSLARVTAWIALVGIACGVASFLVAQAISRGFQQEMQDKILANTAHITVLRKDGADIWKWKELVEKVKQTEGVAKVQPETYDSALISTDNGFSYAVLRGRESDTETRGHGDAAKSEEETGDEILEVEIGAELAEKVGLKIGDEADVLTVSDNSRSLPKQARVRVHDVFKTGLYDYDSTWIYLSLEDAAKIKHTAKVTATALSVFANDIYTADKIAEKLRGNLGEDYKIIDWQEANRPLFSALSLERTIILLIISLIVFLSALNITTTLALVINERRFDIAILRTCGAKTKSLITIFLLEGLILGATGIFSGVVLGAIVCFVGNYFKLISLPTEVYTISSVPFVLSFGDIVSAISVGFILSFLAAVYPSFAASRVKPMEILRN